MKWRAWVAVGTMAAAALVAVAVCAAGLVLLYGVVIGVASVGRPERPPDPMLTPPTTACTATGCRATVPRWSPYGQRDGSTAPAG